MPKKNNQNLQNIRLSDDFSEIIIIDQTKLPGSLTYLRIKSPEECYDAIKSLKVRGAPAIGIFAGYSMYVLMQNKANLSYADFLAEFEKISSYLNSSRPTAVNLSRALERMRGVVLRSSNLQTPDIIQHLKDEAVSIHKEDISMCRRISEYGLSLLKEGDTVLTHCNAGPLATSKYGTALGPLILGKERGMSFRVFADETRPLLQGARLTAFELENAGIDVTLICDSMAAFTMKQKKINAVFVGCDRVAANGDFANKIGTLSLAVLANHYKVPFYALAPSSTIDLKTPSGAEIEIEQRDPEEIKSMWYKERMAPASVKAYNPAFDVTDHEFLSALVTERGIVRPPFKENLASLFKI